MEALNRIRKNRILPVTVIPECAASIPLAESILSGGIDVMEITFRTESAAESIRKVTAYCPEMLVGAGTILNLSQCRKAVDHGAEFIVSPGFHPDIVKWCLDHQVCVIPGCVTPTEIMAALDMGVNTVKFFPANIYGGLKAMNSLCAPFPKLKFLPTGGICQENLQDFLSAPFVDAVGGSWICPPEDISKGNFEKITALCCAASQTAARQTEGWN